VKIPAHTINPSLGTKTRSSWERQPILVPESSRPLQVPQLRDKKAEPRFPSTPHVQYASKAEHPANWRSVLEKIAPEIALGLGATAHLLRDPLLRDRYRDRVAETSAIGCPSPYGFPIGK
jgi:hypothetical protein